MSRYRRRDPYRNKALGNYRIESPKYYRTKKAYFRPYYKILFKRNYKLPLMRKARGRIEGYYKPRQENFRTFEEKYELKPKPEKISAPPILKPLRYTSQSMVETQVDTERIAKEVEGRVKKEITVVNHAIPLNLLSLGIILLSFPLSFILYFTSLPSQFFSS